MKKIDKEYFYKATNNEYFSALVKNPAYCRQLLGVKAKSYSSLLDWLLKNCNQYLLENVGMPSLKKVSELTGIDRPRLNRDLKKMYDDIILLNTEHPEKFVKPGQMLCFLAFENLKSFGSFYAGLNTLPRVDDRFEFDFVVPQNGHWSYFVKSVSHEFANGQQRYRIDLSSEEPNVYLQLLKEKAFLNRRISIHEFYDRNSLSLEEKLVEMYSEL